MTQEPKICRRCENPRPIEKFRPGHHVCRLCAAEQQRIRRHRTKDRKRKYEERKRDRAQKIGLKPREMGNTKDWKPESLSEEEINKIYDGRRYDRSL